MDYTILSNVKLELAIKESSDDTLLAQLITSASRFIDRLATGREDAVDYFKSETVSNEILANYRNPLIDNNGHLVAWPHKPIISTVTAVSWRFAPNQAWQSVDTQYLSYGDGHAVELWLAFERVRPMLQISYTGGLGTTSTSNGVTTTTLPADLVEAATVLTGRFYKEAQSGLTDAVGVAELGMIMYTKALPVRVQEMLARFLRVVPW